MDPELRRANESLLSADDVAHRLGLTTSRVYGLARMNLLPAVRIGRQVRFDGAAIEAWIEAGGTSLPNDSSTRN